MASDWIVVLEAGGVPGGSLEIEVVRDLLEAVADSRPSALYSPDRYALQLVVHADGPVRALRVAVARWSGAVAELGLSEWPLVRAEVVTPAEFERECELEKLRAGLPATGGPLVPIEFVERELIEEELLRRAFSDSLTGLATRELFRDHLEQALLRAHSTGGRRAVLYLDLDDFGTVSERFGRTVADEVLVEVSRRLKGSVRRADTVARMGDDEFAVLLEDDSETGAAAVAHRVVGELRRHQEVHGDRLVVTASAGLVLSEPGQDADAVLRSAGLAMSAAKGRGKARCEVFGR